MPEIGGNQKGFSMTEEQRTAVEWVASQLMYNVPTTRVPNEHIVLPVGENGDAIWTGDMTTYTLGLMLSGMVIMDREGR